MPTHRELPPIVCYVAQGLDGRRVVIAHEPHNGRCVRCGKPAK